MGHISIRVAIVTTQKKTMNRYSQIYLKINVDRKSLNSGKEEANKKEEGKIPLQEELSR